MDRNRRIARVAFVALVSATLSAAWAACKSDRKDSHCTPDSPSYKQDPACIYGANGEMPLFDEGPCLPDGDAGVWPKPAVCPTTTEVLAFFTAADKGNCTSPACHGNSASPAGGILLDPGNPKAFYATLTSVTGSVGTPYVSVKAGGDPYKDSWIVCNVTGQKGGGYSMPPESGVPHATDANVIRDWLSCGAPELQ